MRYPLRCLLPAAIALWVLPGTATADMLVLSAAGPNAASIQKTVDDFRKELGDPNNLNLPGPLFAGRREINWDGAGQGTTVVSPTPFAGAMSFQIIRGAAFTTPGPGTGFVQAPVSGLATLFANPTYNTTFSTFSSQRLFSPIGNNVTDATFTIPGNPLQPAAVQGFGAVFTAVDLPNTTSLEYFTAGGLSLGKFFVPAFPGNGSLSFLGVIFDAEVARVRIVSGNSPLGPNDGGNVDIVAMDDFLYSEPRAIPEPSALFLAGLGLVGLIGYGWYQRRRLA